MEIAPMRLYVSLKCFVIHWHSRGEYLVLERNTHRIYSTGSFKFPEKGVSPEDVFFIDIFLFLGVIPIETVMCIAVVTQARSRGEIRNTEVLEIKEIELIEFNRSESHNNLDSHKLSIKKLFSSGFYFSYRYQLTRPISFGSSEMSLHDTSDSRFYWNLSLFKEFISQNVSSVWFIPVIQGFFSVFHEDDVVLALVSRRSCERAGTRYNCRGIDETGNVANFVETEQILIIRDVVFSYLQIRGSVPIYWEQTGVTAQLSLTKSTEWNLLAFKKHADTLIQQYNHITMINLLSSSKSAEMSLTHEWEKVFNKSYLIYRESLSYTYFDFHANCKGQKFHKVSLLIENISEFMDYYEYYSSTGSIQQGVVRTNCLDCLDRTNVVQGAIAWEVLMSQLRSLNLDYEMKQHLGFTKAFKSQWADNGDYLSLQYTGTGSTISAVTREGTLGLRGLISQSITSISRFYCANIQDDVKQTSIDAVLRKKNKTQIINKIQIELDKRSSEYSEVFEIRVRIVTWNLGKRNISQIEMLTDCDDVCNIVVFAFQQVVEFGEYEDLIGSAMRGYTKLAGIISEEYVVVIYVEDRLIDEITMFDYDIIGLPHRGKATSKQSIAVTFNLFDSSFCFIACHLVSGTDNNTARKEQIKYIHASSFNNSKRLLEPYNAKFLFGDLNFRVNLNTYQTLELLKTKNFEALLSTEQLTHYLKFNYLEEYKEASIKFPPTYPYAEDSFEYDKLKTRGPSWCDRVLYSGNSTCLAYKDIQIKGSCHRPVEALFLVKAKKIDLERKEEVKEKLYDELLPTPLGRLPKMTCAKDLLSCNT